MTKKKKEIEIHEVKDRRPYVLWKRVSTEGQGESGLGLEAQEAIAKMFMKKDPIAVFTDVFSGTKLKQCKGLSAAISLCKKDDYLLVVPKCDRFRNVQEALEILDEVGDGNLLICDLPTTDRFVLTVMFAMYERQAIIGRLNTRLALAERKKQIERDGGFVSKAGNFCTHLGGAKGTDTSMATMASVAKKKAEKEEWRKTGLYPWVELQLRKGRSRKDIVAEARGMYEKTGGDKNWSTRGGRPLSEAILSLWAKDILPVI